MVTNKMFKEKKDSFIFLIKESEQNEEHLLYFNSNISQLLFKHRSHLRISSICWKRERQGVTFSHRFTGKYKIKLNKISVYFHHLNLIVPLIPVAKKPFKCAGPVYRKSHFQTYREYDQNVSKRLTDKMIFWPVWISTWSSSTKLMESLLKCWIRCFIMLGYFKGMITPNIMQFYDSIHL